MLAGDRSTWDRRRCWCRKHSASLDRDQNGLRAHQLATFQLQLIVLIQAGKAHTEALGDRFRALAFLRGIGLPGIPVAGFQIALELLSLVDEDGDENLEFVLAVLRSYEGQTFIYKVCKAIVKTVI